MAATAYAVDPIQLTSKGEIESRMGAYAVSVLDAEATTTKWNMSIAEASDTVVLYCQKRAPMALLSANRWTRGKATVIGCYLMSGFAGEAHNGAYDTEYEAALEELRLVASMEMDIPGIVYGEDGNPFENKDAGPVGSNMAVDLMAYPVVRVDVGQSTGMRQGVPGFPYRPTTYPPRRYG